MSSPLPLVVPGSWHEEANCKDVEVDVFFSLDEEDQREALARCNGCQVRPQCLEYAVVNREQYGIWGGTREQERRRLMRDRRRYAA
ncbi:WhiB family transcriptional regulator [Egicoccus halophilus]|uniref:Transcriptional regulator WhiB n=1 Tax=Egicoccus halophilus TaxID=1670830 RepID=A0A8J3ABA6_9ACTN|nr:WhiB family transcriptional regulator [Egicoccus halophilus]GGI07249.1 hypothetical protein GCM10011354_23140 [Egicoccus halophilus]